jgi:hypothetical protein
MRQNRRPTEPRQCDQIGQNLGNDNHKLIQMTYVVLSFDLDLKKS